MNKTPPFKEMERAVKARDRSYDGVFFTAIRTTGIFCRPSCPTRAALPHNREFFPTAGDALLAGYRPCKRCRPLDTDGKPPEWVETLMNTIERNPSVRVRDAELRSLGIDPARARRYFSKHYNMTFQAYSRRRRMGQALKQIRNGSALDTVALSNGYESHSGFRDAFRRTFGRAPGTSRGSDCVVASWIESPLGPLVAAANRDGICLLEFSDRRALERQFTILQKRFGAALVPGNHEFLDQLRDELAKYFAGQLTEFRVPLVYPGTPFQLAAWERLRQIPYGHTLSYEQQAHDMGYPGAQRAVGTANGQNRLAILIPCHRVVKKDGKLGGYGGGLWRKQLLLDLEQETLRAQNRPAAQVSRALLPAENPGPVTVG